MSVAESVSSRRLAALLAVSLALAGCAAVPPATPQLPRSEDRVTLPPPPPAGLRPTLELAKPPVADTPAPVLDTSRNIYFTSGSATIEREGRTTLARAAEQLKEGPRRHITLTGHTDDSGSREFNVALAQRRVAAVADALEALGVPARQIRRVSYGNELASVDPCRTPACLAAQRRVELQIDE